MTSLLPTQSVKSQAGGMGYSFEQEQGFSLSYYAYTGPGQ